LTGSKFFAGGIAALMLLPAAGSMPSRAQSPATQTVPKPAPKPASSQVFQFALQNGMQVLVIPDHRAPVVTQMVWFKVGAVDDPPGVSAWRISSST
jgi:zinc protease